MFDNVGRNLDQEARKRQAQSVVLTALLFGAVGAGVFAWAAWQVKEIVLEDVLDDDVMVEVVMEDPELEEAPPPPPPPPPPPAAATPEPEVEEEEEEPEEEEIPEPDEMVEDVQELEDEPEDAVVDKDPPKGGMEGGIEGGQEGGQLGGVLGGQEGGVIGGELGGGPRVFHHSEVEIKRRSNPRYPDAARDLDLGNVSCLVRIFIDEKGIPYDVGFESCPKVFHGATRDAMLNWRFYPAKFEGEKVKAQFLLRINYQLK